MAKKEITLREHLRKAGKRNTAPKSAAHRAAIRAGMLRYRDAQLARLADAARVAALIPGDKP